MLHTLRSSAIREADLDTHLPLSSGRLERVIRNELKYGHVEPFRICQRSRLIVELLVIEIADGKPTQVFSVRVRSSSFKRRRTSRSILKQLTMSTEALRLMLRCMRDRALSSADSLR
jgi:hypothetical protein